MPAWGFCRQHLASAYAPPLSRSRPRFEQPPLPLRPPSRPIHVDAVAPEPAEDRRLKVLHALARRRDDADDLAAGEQQPVPTPPGGPPCSPRRPLSGGRGARPLLGVHRVGGVDHDDHQRPPTPPAASPGRWRALDRVVGRPQARRVDERDGDPVEVGQLADPVASCAGRSAVTTGPARTGGWRASTCRRSPPRRSPPAAGQQAASARPRASAPASAAAGGDPTTAATRPVGRAAPARPARSAPAAGGRAPLARSRRRRRVRQAAAGSAVGRRSRSRGGRAGRASPGRPTGRRGGSGRRTTRRATGRRPGRRSRGRRRGARRARAGRARRDARSTRRGRRPRPVRPRGPPRSRRGRAAVRSRAWFSGGFIERWGGADSAYSVLRIPNCVSRSGSRAALARYAEYAVRNTPCAARAPKSHGPWDPSPPHTSFHSTVSPSMFSCRTSCHWSSLGK